jgi:dTDP-4-amino-4,6-dideoxygalactose transaminase
MAEHTWFHRQVNLPIYPQLTDEQIDFMICSVSRILSR